MSIEYGDKSKIEPPKLEQKESDKPKTGKEALDFLKQEKAEGKKEVKENQEMPDLSKESLSGKQALDIVAQERQAQKSEKSEGLSPSLGGMDGGDKGGKDGNEDEFEDLSGPKEGDTIRREYIEGNKKIEEEATIKNVKKLS